MGGKTPVNGEILSLETAEKLAKLDHIEKMFAYDIVRKPMLVDWIKNNKPSTVANNILYCNRKALDCQERIDKAIEYIEKCRYYHEGVHKQYEYVMYPDEIVSLLNILQGEDKPAYECMDCGCWFEEPFEGSCPKCHSGDICNGLGEDTNVKDNKLANNKE